MENKKILVTGGAGFIGSHLVEALLKTDCSQVRVLDNFSTGNYTNLDNVCFNPKFKLISGDICNLNTCTLACKDIDIVFHQAAMVSVPGSFQNPIKNNSTNISGMLNMLIAAEKCGVKHFVYASSASVYGNTDGVKSEDDPRDYASPYALSKGVDEDYASLIPRKMTCIGLRYFNVFGPRQDPKSPYSGVITIFMDRLQRGEQVTVFGDGQQTRDYVHVSDIVQANLLAGTAKSAARNVVYNVGTGVSTTVLQLLEAIGKKAVINFADPRPGDVKHSRARIDKIVAELGYKPQQTLANGLAEM